MEEAKQSTQNSTSGDQTQKNHGKNSSTKKKKSGSACAAQESDENNFDNAWMARETMTERDLPMIWIINSGASRHMTPNESIFTSKQSVQTTVTVANGEKLHAQGIGDVKVNINSQLIQMKDVLYVPDLDTNLLSISALNQNRFSVLFTGSEVEIRQKGILIASRVLKGRMYLLQSSQVAFFTKEVSDSLEIPTNKMLALYRLWHSWIGHVNPKQLAFLLDYVTGIDRVSLLILQDLNCTTCLNYSNMTRIVNQDTPKCANQQLERVHTDIWGPYRVPSIGGHVYFVSLIDDLTRKSWFIPMKSWKKIYHHISKWQTAISLQTGEKVAIYRCDNTKKY